MNFLRPRICRAVEGQGFLGEEMKGKRHRAGVAAAANSDGQSDTQREIRNFMRALNSYPERFADNPYLSFEQYLFSIASTSNVAGEGSRQN